MFIELSRVIFRIYLFFVWFLESGGVCLFRVFLVWFRFVFFRFVGVCFVFWRSWGNGLERVFRFIGYIVFGCGLVW